MSPVGRRLKIGDYVLLPKGSAEAPDDGILYAEIIGTCMLDKLNKFNASVSKRRPGWQVKVYTNDDSESLVLEIPKTYHLVQYCSTELEGELEERPKEFLGMLVGRGLLDKDGNEFINYGQVHGVSLRDGVTMCTVFFRKLPDGSTLANMEFHGEDLLEFEVSLLQFTLGLGVGTKYKSADRRVCTLRTILEHMTKHDDHDQWMKEFDSFSVARPDQKVLDPSLESVEISLPKILSGWPALAQYIPVSPVKPSKIREVSKNLHVDFNMDDEGFGECRSGNPVTPVRVAASLESQNSRRQEFRSSAMPQVLPLPSTHRRHVSANDHVELQHQNSYPREMEQAENGPSEDFRRLSLSPDGYDEARSNHIPNYSKHGYHPTRAQLQKHKITFKNGSYGKSHTLIEASTGIEEVLTQELMNSVKADEAYIRAWCIMMGDLTLVPMFAWRNATLLANNFEESYMPVNWNKLPELKVLEVVDMDDFWVLYHSMEQAAARYYVDSYCALLSRTRQNLNGGFLVVGGRAGFIGMRVAVRRNIIHVLVSYLRRVVNRFVSEVLAGRAEAMEWMSREATMSSPMYDQYVRTRLTNLQLSELASRAHHGGEHNSGSGDSGQRARSDGTAWTSQMPDGLRSTIPKEEGKNMCLMSYTSQGCKKKNDGCKYQHKKAGSPKCPGPLSEWIKSTYGSYVGPQ